MSDNMIKICKIGFFLANVCLLIGVKVVDNIEQKKAIDKSVKTYLDKKYSNDTEKEGI